MRLKAPDVRQILLIRGANTAINQARAAARDLSPFSEKNFFPPRAFLNLSLTVMQQTITSAKAADAKKENLPEAEIENLSGAEKKPRPAPERGRGKNQWDINLGGGRCL